MRVGTDRDIWSTTFLPCPRFRAAIDCKSLVSTKGHLTYVCCAVRLYTKLYQRRSLRLRDTNVRCLILNDYLLPYARLLATNFCSAYPSCAPSSFPFRLLCIFIYCHSVDRRSPQ